ncbi:Polysaccharide pyruvyl transferase family protein WcaK [Arboricoccus pini]|uniref:Polysaccharide pyruvyl transferase family protein WcaK n=1 Tax=Arboricoccus pini TaxID=1963835 RepID=A0A212RR82_9PROT|nr:polysaccharide pyruvyl transferase family protein [Arboricoccus pini]SNB75120.1 Polysaccharide pyruvyl transferase family protein WcaK [Arboricoccus pini]
MRSEEHLASGNARAMPAAPMSRRKIAICGLPYSPNLGDGVISECLAHLVAKLEPGATVVRIDLAGREDFIEREHGRQLFMSVAHRLPAFLRQNLVRAILTIKVKRKLAQRWAEELRGVDAALIGGGQLLDDVDLNFPIKVETMASCLDKLAIPYTIVCVGASRNWSRVGSELFKRALTSPFLRKVTVRDATSMDSLTAQISPDKLPAYGVIPDPAIVANEVYGHRAPGTTSTTIGINVADPINLGYSGSVSEGLTPEAWLSVYEDLVQASSECGLEPVLFTNGAFEDDAYCAKVAAHLKRIGHDVPSTARPTTPAEMAALIAPHRLVISPRLHACIVAEAFGIPSIALGPVRKLEAFYRALEMPLRQLKPDTFKTSGTGEIVAIIKGALAANNDAAMQSGRARVERGITELLDLTRATTKN